MNIIKFFHIWGGDFYLDIDSPYELEESRLLAGATLIKGDIVQGRRVHIQRTTELSIPEVKKLIEKAKFDASFESKLCD